MAPTFSPGCALVAGLALVGLAVLPGLAQDTIEVDASQVLRTFNHNPIGINVNHLMDADAKRPAGSRPLTTALKELGVASLRFPEGELGDSYLWAMPPFPVQAAAHPQWALRGPGLWPSKDLRFSTPDFQPKADIMSFDGFLGLAHATGAWPVIIVAYDSAYKKIGKGESGPTVAELITSAAAWVRYANVTKGRKIRYWEIGNESDISPEAHSGGDPGAKQYAEDVVAFAQAMRKEDPSIKIGISVWQNKRLMELLEFPDLWPQVDFVSLHNYPTFGWKEGYETFRAGKHNLVYAIQEANALIEKSSLSPADKARIEFLVTETSAIDWAKKERWANVADHGHALVMFEIIGQTLLQPRVSQLHQWVTRWTHNDDAGQPLRVYDALTPNNQLTPMGQALSLWGKHLGRQLVAAAGTEMVHVYASPSPAKGLLAVFLLNKDTRSHRIRLKVHDSAGPKVLSIHRLSAASPEALSSSLTELPALSVLLEDMELPPLSVTVLELTQDSSGRRVHSINSQHLWNTMKSPDKPSWTRASMASPAP